MKKSKTPVGTKPTKKENVPVTLPVVASKKSSGTANKVNGVSEAKESNNLPVVKEKKVAKKAGSKKSQPELIETANDEEEDEEGGAPIEEQEDNDAESDMDDQTLALLQGFESDGDDEPAKDGEAFKEGQAVPRLNLDAIGLSKKEQKKLKKADAKDSEKPGVIYVGRVPHGFYEQEMKAYFKQFGNISKLRLSRNKHTGASKHFAFIQFESATVADIVARTMDNYLMFGHILKVKLIPDEQVHEDMFKGANKRFKKVPWNKIEGRKLEQGASEAVWDERIKKEEARREKKADTLKAIGYEFEAPEIKSTKDVEKKEQAPAALTEEVADERKAIEAVPVAEDSAKPKKKGKAVKDAPVQIETTKAVEVVPVIAESSKPKKGKKVKALNEVVEEAGPAIIDESVKPEGKKSKVTKAAEPGPVVEVAVHAPEPTLKKKSKATLVVEPVVAAEEPALKKKKSKTTLVESVIAVPEAPAEKAKKPKKSKK